MRNLVMLLLLAAACNRDNGKVKDQEVSRLAAENAKLKQQIAAQGSAASKPVPKDPVDMVIDAVAPGYDSTAVRNDLQQVALDSDAEIRDVIAVFRVIGNGRRPEQALRVGGTLLDHWTIGGEQMRMNLGIPKNEFYDGKGQLRFNLANVGRLRHFYLRRAGSEDSARRLASFANNLGPEVAAALFRPGIEAELASAPAK